MRLKKTSLLPLLALAPNKGEGSGGGATSLVQEVIIDESAPAAKPDDDGVDDEGMSEAETPKPDEDDLADLAPADDEDEGLAPEPEPEADQAAAGSANPAWEEEARRAGWVKPEATADAPEAQPVQPAQQVREVPAMELAQQIAQAQGITDYDTVVGLAVQIEAERTEVRSLRRMRPIHIRAYEADFEAQGLPKEAAGLYFDNLLAQGPANMDRPEFQQVALDNALGQFYRQQLKAGKKPLAAAAEQPAQGEQPTVRRVTPTSASGTIRGGADLSQFDAQDRQYIREWAKRYNNDKRPTAQQLAEMKANGEIG